MEIQEAIENNERILNDLNRKQNPWIKKRKRCFEMVIRKKGGCGMNK